MRAQEVHLSAPVSGSRRRQIDTLPEDPILPQLHDALDADLMSGMFQSLLGSKPASPNRIHTCKLDRFRYRRSERAIMLYELSVGGSLSDESKQQRCWVTGQIFRGSKAKKRFDVLRDLNANTNNQTLLPVAFLAEFEMLVQCFPYDRHMPGLAEIMDFECPGVNALLIGQFGAGDRDILEREIDPVRYRPGVGATMRASITAHDSRDGDAVRKTAYIKVYRQPAAATDAYRLLNTLCDAGEASATPFSTARPIGFDAASSALVLAPARGRSVEDLLLSGENPETAAIRCANALAAFHQSELPMPRHRSRQAVLARARRAVSFLSWGCPDLRHNLDRLYSRIDLQLKSVPACPTHLDLKVEHLFLDDDKVTMIDMDSYAGADPVYDPAMLLARLDVMPELLPVQPHDTATFSSLFMERYFAAVPPEWNARFATNYACAALKVALYFLQHLEPDWRNRIGKIITRAEARLNGEL